LSIEKFILLYIQAISAGYDCLALPGGKGKGPPSMGMLVLAGKWTPKLQRRVDKASPADRESIQYTTIAKALGVPADWVAEAERNWSKHGSGGAPVAVWKTLKSLKPRSSRKR
jgi:hypothetical protein